MKEATGELNMTIVTIVAVSAIGALLWFVIWPMIQKMITETTCQTYGEDWHAVKVEGLGDAGKDDVGQGQATMNKYGCCQGTENNPNVTWNDKCINPTK